MGKRIEAEDVVALSSKSTVKSSEKALSRGAMDIRRRDDIDRHTESPDRYFRMLEDAEKKLQAAKALKRKALQALLAFKQGLAMPSKDIMDMDDKELEPKVVKPAKAQDPKRDRTSKSAKRRAARSSPAPAREAQEAVDREVLENREGDKEKVPANAEEPNVDSDLDGGSEDRPADDAGADSGDGSVEEAG